MRHVLAWLPAVVVAGVIFWLSNTPNLAVSSGLTDFVLRKGAHLTVYALLAVSCWRGLTHHGVRDRRALAGAWLMAVAYAVTDELHQATVPTRHGAPEDVLIDAVGAAAGLVLLQLVPRLDRVVAVR